MNIDPPSLIAVSLFESGVTGAVSSLGTISVCHPLFTIKTRLMSKLPFPRYHQIYKGYHANLMCDMSYQVVAFLGFTYFSKKIMENKPLSPKEQFLGGIFAGIVAAPLLSVLERIMILQQVHEGLQHSGSTKQVINSIVRSEGRAGLFRGLTSTILRESISGACFFGLSQCLYSKISKVFDNATLAQSLAYQLSGAISGVLSSPFDLIKTRMQNHIGPNEGLKQCIKEIGVRNLFVGSLARSCTISSTMMAMGFFSNKIQKIMPQANA